MKKLSTLFILSIIYFTSYAQAPKKANSIIVSNSNTAEQNFVLVKKALAEGNIEIGNQDKDVFQIKSGLINITKSGTNGYYFFNCRQNEIIIKGQYRSGLDIEIAGVKTIDDFTPIENIGMKGSTTKKAFLKMDEFAAKLGGDLSYKVSK